MLASNGMRLARELRSPLFPALLLAAAAIFFARDPGSAALPWLGIAAFVLVGVLFATQSPPNGAVVFAPLVALAAWCALSVAWSVEADRSWDYTNRAFLYVGFALVGAYLARDISRLLVRLLGPARRGLRLGARREGVPVAPRGVRADRAPERADRLLERARAARRHRAADGPLPRDPQANGRDAARLRLARRDRAHLLSRRPPRRDRRGRPLDDPLEGLARVALDAARRRAPRDRLAGRRLRALGDHERRAVAQHACSRRARVRRRAHRERRDRRRALALRAAGDLARPAPGARGPRDPCRRVARGRSRARSQLVEHVHQAVRDRASQLTEPARPVRVELPLGMVDPGLGRLGSEPDRRHRRRLVRRHEQALPPDEPRRDDRAAQPARPVPERDRARRGRSLPRLDRLADRPRPSPPRPSARARARAYRPTSCTGRSTSTGTSSRSRRPCS